jgi:secreted trypsin-like serine protease
MQADPHSFHSIISCRVCERSKIRRIKICFPILLLTAFAYAVDADAAVQVSNDSGTKIVGGKPAAQGAYPSYAIPDFSDGLCGATLIHSDILISAAHCKGVFANDSIYIGGNKLS